MSYKQKYLKYKSKYLDLKNQLGGVLLPSISQKLREANFGEGIYLPNERYHDILGEYYRRHDKYRESNWANALHTTGNFMPDDMLLEIFKESLFNYYIKENLSYPIIRVYDSADMFIENPKPRYFIYIMQTLNRFYGDSNQDPAYKKLLEISETLIAEKEAYTFVRQGITFRQFLEANNVYNYLRSQIETIRSLLSIVDKIRLIFNNKILQKAGIVYQRLKIILEKMGLFTREDRFYYIDISVKELLKDDAFERQYKNTMIKTDKLSDIIQTMIYNHIYIIMNQLIEEGIRLIKAGERLDSLDAIALSMPPFYTEPEYQIIIAGLDRLMLPILDDNIKDFKLSDEILSIL